MRRTPQLLAVVATTLACVPSAHAAKPGQGDERYLASIERTYDLLARG